MHEPNETDAAGSPAELLLTAEEARVLGCLIEKALTTPEYYPLSIKALQSGCNQKSNRDPVVAYSEDTLEEALQGLREKRLAVLVHTADGRVPRFRHTLEQRLSLTPQEVAVLCVLLLRGPQTPGELRGRTGRMYTFGDLSEVQATLDSLMHDTRPPAVCKLPKEPGRKEARFAHLLCGPVDAAVENSRPPRPMAPPGATSPSLVDRVKQLEEAVAALQETVARLDSSPPAVPPITHGI